MATNIELIYCSGGNRKFASIAIEAGFFYGAQLPDTIYFPPYFCDQNWKDPDRERYMAGLAEYRPTIATVLDWWQENQLPEVLAWAEDAASFVEVVVIIPKVIGGIERLPHKIGGKPVRLGYSVPTKYSGTSVPAWEFEGWPVHLLGGSPHRQYELSYYLNVVSVDGNMQMKMATDHCRFWAPGNARFASNRWWPILHEANGGERWGDGSATAGAPYEAFRRSCENIIKMWRKNGQN